MSFIETIGVDGVFVNCTADEMNSRGQEEKNRPYKEKHLDGNEYGNVEWLTTKPTVLDLSLDTTRKVGLQWLAGWELSLRNEMIERREM